MDPDNIQEWAEANQDWLRSPEAQRLGLNYEAIRAGEPEAYTKFEDAWLAHQAEQQARQGAAAGAPSGQEGNVSCEKPVKTTMTFARIAGASAAKRELNIGFVYPQQFPGLFQTPSRGLLLLGPPGTGKTLLAKAATNELKDVAFYAPTPAELKGKFVGETEKNIARWFRCARDERPQGYTRSVIFFDEFENIAGKRGGGNDPGLTASVTALLQAMDGLTSSPNVAVMAATNYPDRIDAAILRRFSARVFVDLPTFEARLFLIARKIAENYQPDVVDSIRVVPTRVSEEGVVLRYALEPADKLFANINKYGRYNWESKLSEPRALIKDSKRSLFECTECPIDYDRVVDERDLYDIAALTGPKDTSAVRATMGKSGRFGDIEFSNRARFKYGFSGSDIDKMMDMIFNSASYRALPKDDDGKENVMAQVVTRNNQREYIYLAQSDEDLENIEVVSVRSFGEEENKLYFTYDLTLCDVCAGLGNFKPTTDPKLYESLVEYQESGE